MADPLSIAAGVAGLVSLAVQITQGLHDYYNAYRRQRDDVAHLCSNIDGLVASLTALSKALEDRQTSDELIQSIERSVEDCRGVIEELREELDKIRPQESEDLKTGLQAAGRRLRYPFRKSTLQKLDEDITEFRRNISIALDVLSYQDSQLIKEDIDEIKITVDQVRRLHTSQKLRDRLQPPDPSSNHYEACTKRHPATGQWFIEGSEFKSWLKGNNWLWLTGFAGCGKSILCSTAIKETFSYKTSSELNIGVCYFYFSFTDNSKQDVGQMMLSIILQLSDQTDNGKDKLDRLFEAEPTTIPSLHTLLAIFRSLFVDFDNVYLLIDALDEVPLPRNRDNLLNTLETFHSWKEPKLHILTTSRDYGDIRNAMEPFTETVAMKNEGIDGDILRFVREQLATNRRLRKWSKNEEYYKRIEEALSVGAQGVFRWVECQLETLASTPASRAMLEKALQSLPVSLDQTYERMLLNINAVAREEARRVLLLLCFSQRPVFDREIIDFLAISKTAQGEFQFDPDNRIDSVDDILDICPGFLHVSEDFHDHMPARKLQIAHFSVQEYLMSDRISETAKVVDFYLEPSPCHNDIVQACLTYLVSGILAGVDSDSGTELVNLRRKYPFCKYACLYWDAHFRACDIASGPTIRIAFKLLVSNYVELKTIFRIRRSVGHSQSIHLCCEPRLSALQLASTLGLCSLVSHTLKQVKQSAHPIPDLVNQNEAKAFPEGSFKSDFKPPQEPPGFRIHHSETSFLEDALEEDPLNALHTAVSSNNFEIVELLLNHGMNIDALGASIDILPDLRFKYRPMPDPSPALFWALLEKNVHMSKFLISRGADVQLTLRQINSNDCAYIRSCLTVSFWNQIGIDPFLQSRSLGRKILEEAISREDLATIKQCLLSGIGIAQDSGDSGSCLLCATIELARFPGVEWIRARRKLDDPSDAYKLEANVEEIINLMFAPLKSDFDPNIGCETCLHWAASVGRSDLVHCLITHFYNKFGLMKCTYLCTLATLGALSNLKLLGQASESSARILEQLCKAGARPGYVASQLLWFRRRDNIGNIPENLDCLELLTDYRSDLSNEQQFVLFAALGDINGVKGLLGTTQSLPKDLAIAWAARFGHVGVVKQLILHYHSFPPWALIDAVQSQNFDVLDPFLELGVDCDKDDGRALSSAVKQGWISIAQSLLEHGANPDRPVEDFSTYSTLDRLPAGFDLEECTSYGFSGGYLTPKAPILMADSVEMVELLLKHGANLTTYGALALNQACCEEHSELAEFFIKHGVDASVTWDDRESALVWPSWGGKLGMLEILCDAGAPINPPPNEKLEYYDNPLIAACDARNMETIRWLLDRGAIVYYQTLYMAEGYHEGLRTIHAHLKMHGAHIRDMCFK